MITKGRRGALISCSIVFLLALFIAGCGGGGDSAGGSGGGGGNDNPTPPSNLTVDVNADAGKILEIYFSVVGANPTVTLDGHLSRASSLESVTYAWSFTYMPVNSKAKLTGENTDKPTFIADKEGTYIVQLVVSAEGVASTRAIATVEVAATRPTLGTHYAHNTLNVSCINCHNGVTIQQTNGEPVRPKSPTHVATSNMCAACHSTIGYEVIRVVDHQEVFGNCSECHNGVIAIGKSKNHQETSGECSDCHDTSAFLTLVDGKFDHSNIARSCSSCHDGIITTGKTATHIATTRECNFCHTPTSPWNSARPDHVRDPAVVGHVCSDCHITGGTGKAQPTGHPVTIGIVDCGICHNTENFKFIDPVAGIRFNHSVDPSVMPCDACHTLGNVIGAPDKTTTTTAGFTHLTTTSDCGSCHTTLTFTTGYVDHETSADVLNKRCDSCHNNVSKYNGSVVPGLPTNGSHIVLVYVGSPAMVEDCVLCHSPGSFKTGFFDHNAATRDIAASGCSICHNGVIAIGKPGNHVETSADCSAAGCHAPDKFDNFLGASVDHQTLVDPCATCHNGVTAVDQPATHIPTPTGVATLDCGVCHGTNGELVPSSFRVDLKFTHQTEAIVKGCTSCHNGRYTVSTGKSVQTHVPTTQECNICHASVTTFTDHSNFKHTGINGNCKSCHSGGYFDKANAMGLVQANVNLGKLEPPKVHVTIGTKDCAVCHSVKADFTGATIDHTDTTSVTAMNCSTCHKPFGEAAGSGTSAPQNQADGSQHPTTTNCGTCHVAGGSFAPATIDHTTYNAQTNCAQAGCHDGSGATGQSANHIPTNRYCGVCHSPVSTTGFKLIPPTYDHLASEIKGKTCGSCHDGVIALGKKDASKLHLTTNADCGGCHTTNAFSPALNVDHSTFTKATDCAQSGCHGGSNPGSKTIASKTNPPHWTTTLKCGECHGTAAFNVNAIWVHGTSSSDALCDTCHSLNGGAKDKTQATAPHFVTDIQCSKCHTTSDTTRGFTPIIIYAHISTDKYPGTHNTGKIPATAAGCLKCHKINTEAPTYGTTTYGTSKTICASCHANDFDSGESKHKIGTNGNRTVEANKECAASGCHKVSDKGWG